mmetsp:Transcript_23234/g.60806  ORF Transcript_23234/g.60806 Transcript_23234/m.60806 type:complete len:236 (+) Transcript_23234:189-896(+)
MARRLAAFGTLSAAVLLLAVCGGVRGFGHLPLPSPFLGRSLAGEAFPWHTGHLFDTLHLLQPGLTASAFNPHRRMVPSVRSAMAPCSAAAVGASSHPPPRATVPVPLEAAPEAATHPDPGAPAEAGRPQSAPKQVAVELSPLVEHGGAVQPESVDTGAPTADEALEAEVLRELLSEVGDHVPGVRPEWASTETNGKGRVDMVRAKMRSRPAFHTTQPHVSVVPNSDAPPDPPPQA